MPYVALASDTNGMYSLVEVVILPGEGSPPHTHLNEDEGFYVLEGKFKVWLANREPVELDPGDHAFGPRNIEHYFRNVGETTGRLLLIFTPGGYERYFIELAQARADGGADLSEKVKAIDKKYGTIINRPD